MVRTFCVWAIFTILGLVVLLMLSLSAYPQRKDEIRDLTGESDGLIRR